MWKDNVGKKKEKRSIVAKWKLVSEESFLKKRTEDIERRVTFWRNIYGE